MILIVDDIPENIFSLKKVLELNNFSVDTASSGEEALKKILKNSYFLIILDVQMPGMDGFEVAETISGYSKTKDIPIIFLSAVNTDKKFITKGYEYGGLDYVTKPFDADILLLKVKTFYRLYKQKIELKFTQESLREEIEVRKAAENKKDEFISIASHELKTPLTSIKGYVQLLDRSLTKYKDPVLSNYITRTNLQIHKLQSLVNDLLDISKIDSGQIEFNIMPFEFSAMVKNAIETIQQTHDCKISFSKTMDAIVFADEQRIEQVIINFLTNAVKYSPDSKDVEVSITGGSDQTILLTVKDYGIGIPEEMQANVFNKFYRVEESSTKFQGLGIGLYISDEIIRRHKGFCGLRSEPGKGSEFFFSLPINGHQ
ncbi:ATP-binding response regulator [Daejeonella oryzae]|uniref:ATP-binding response regulator n=1 Tax=Daejeonella oryzae TaxID=1122943 RepID=UPI0003F74548|nr:hybrid sensor histidine kinase/response regulator [Daejeonella oryzae]